MELWYPAAVRKPLGPQTEQRITPRIFVIHTMSGYLAGTDSMFRQGGYSGTESHFGVGGAYDGANDGAVWQWQDLAHSADAQYAGNAYATSVETSDGARSGVRWSPKQAESIVRLGVWWCQETGHPARLVTSPSGTGFGWHAQFAAWNHEAHDCPGAVRLKQYKTEIIPEIARRLAGGSGTEDDVPEYVSVGVAKQQALPPGQWVTVAWGKEYADSTHQHLDTGSSSILKGPAKYALTAALTLRGLPAGTDVDVRAVEVDATDASKVDAGPVQELTARAGDTLVLYGLPADVLGDNRRLRVQVRQRGTGPAAVVGGSAKVLFWR